MARRMFATAFLPRPAQMLLTDGRTAATVRKTTRLQPAMFRATPSVIATSMITELGMKCRNTVPSGTRPWWTPGGLLTATAIGAMWARGAGPGSTMRPGVMRHSTMGAGLSLAAAGAGARDLTTCG